MCDGATPPNLQKVSDCLLIIQSNTLTQPDTKLYSEYYLYWISAKEVPKFYLQGGQEGICRKSLGLVLCCFSMADFLNKDKAGIVVQILCRPIEEIAKNLPFTLMPLIKGET